jgi:hypothetical protein
MMDYKKNIAIIITLLLVLQPAFCQEDTEQWAIQAGGKYSDVGTAICIDNSNNVYITGHFQQDAMFGKKELSSFGDTDIFLAKYNDKGELVWVRKAGSHYTRPITITETGSDIAIDNSNNIYVTGNFKSHAVFDDKELISSGNDDIFIAKYDENGSLMWLNQIGGHLHDLCKSITIDNNGHLLLAGKIQDKVSFGNHEIKVHNNAIFVGKYKSSGELLWVETFNNSSFNTTSSIYSGIDNNIYITGYFYDSVNFDKKYVSQGLYDSYILMLSANGDVMWSCQLSGKNSIKSTSIATDKEGNIYAGGFFEGVLECKDKRVEAVDENDIFLMKFNKNRKLLWLKSAGGAGDDECHTMAIDEDKIYIAGDFWGNAFFDNDTIQAVDASDIFIACYSKAGNLLWVEAKGNKAQEDIYDMVFDHNNKLCITGYFRDQLVLNNDILESKGRQDIFVAKLNATYSDEDNSTKKSFTLSMDEYEDFDAKIYPNPNNGKYSLILSGHVECIEFIEINDMYGRTVKVKEVEGKNPNSIKFDMSGYAKGTYTINVKGAKTSKTYKLIIGL